MGGFTGGLAVLWEKKIGDGMTLRHVEWTEGEGYWLPSQLVERLALVPSLR